MRQTQKEDIIFTKTAEAAFLIKIADAIPIIINLAAMLLVVPLGLLGLLALLVQLELPVLLELLVQQDLQASPDLPDPLVLPVLLALPAKQVLLELLA
jgi:hypothetical protein